MIKFIADITYLDDENILRRNRKYSFESDNLINAVFVLKDRFTIKKIRSLNEIRNLTVKNNNFFSFIKK